ncbi:tetratricopeptide repeat protein, partial [Candidatus Amoebophilus asiaticus]|nr:tetratricopeptide repeat protein [Candidatus Amoebophilus asiaticus]
IEEGMKYLQRGLVVDEELGDKTHMAISYSSLGGWQLKLGQFGEALENGQLALELAREVGFPDKIKRAAHLLSYVYRAIGYTHQLHTPKSSRNKFGTGSLKRRLSRAECFERALEYYELEVEMRDSIVNEEHQKATIRQQMKYEYEKAQLIKEQKEKEEARLVAEATTRNNNLQYSGILIGIILIFSGILALGKIPFTFKSYRAYKNLRQLSEGLIFLTFLLFFEFVLVLLDPLIEAYSGGGPAYKLLFNAVVAACIFPLHQFFESKMKKRIVNTERLRLKKQLG